MAAKPPFQNDLDADILHVSTRPPYPEQESEELGDGVMHDGIAPLRPFSLANPFHETVSLSVLHLGLVALPVVGGVLLVFVARELGREAKTGTRVRDAADEPGRLK